MFVTPFSFADAAPSASPVIQSMVISISEYQKLNVDKQKEIASIWSLNIKDYKYYLWLMEHSANGWHYADKHLDPCWILGFNAKNDEERQKFVDIAIKNERIRLEGELAFQRAFSKRFKELYPDEFPIRYTAFTTIKK
jgi:integrating conjugative element protein (TIGR03759 family)